MPLKMCCSCFTSVCELRLILLLRGSFLLTCAEVTPIIYSFVFRWTQWRNELRSVVRNIKMKNNSSSCQGWTQIYQHLVYKKKSYQTVNPRSDWSEQLLMDWWGSMGLSQKLQKGFLPLCSPAVSDGEDDPQPWLVCWHGQPEPLRGEPLETGCDLWPPALWCRDRQWVHVLLPELPHQPPRKCYKGKESKNINKTTLAIAFVKDVCSSSFMAVSTEMTAWHTLKGGVCKEPLLYNTPSIPGFALYNLLALLMNYAELFLSDHVSDAKPPSQLLLLSTSKGASTSCQHKAHAAEQIPSPPNPYVQPHSAKLHQSSKILR